MVKKKTTDQADPYRSFQSSLMLEVLAPISARLLLKTETSVDFIVGRTSEPLQVGVVWRKIQACTVG